MITSKNLKAIRPGDKLLKAFMDRPRTYEVYDSRLRDDLSIKRLQDFGEDYTIDVMDKGVPSLATKE